jgi:protein phosphatase
MKQEAAMGSENARPAVRLEVDVQALTHVGKVREKNEDAYAVYRIGRFLERLASNLPDSIVALRREDSGTVMAVADGMGGAAAGEVASRTAIATILQLIAQSPKWALSLDDPNTRDREIDQMWERGRRYIAEIHAAVRRRAADDPALAGMGTTFTSAYNIGHDLFVAHVGDSRAYLYRRGCLTQVTKDQTIAREYADMGMIDESDIKSHRLSHVLTQAVGGPDEKIAASLHSLSIDAGDRLLLCTDGLTNPLDDEDIGPILGRTATSREACAALIDLALERGAPDNVTVIVATFSAGNGV